MLTFRSCLEMWLDDPRFGKSQQTLRYANRIDRRADGLSPGSVLELEEAEWQLLSEVGQGSDCQGMSTTRP